MGLSDREVYTWAIVIISIFVALNAAGIYLWKFKNSPGLMIALALPDFVIGCIILLFLVMILVMSMNRTK